MVPMGGGGGILDWNLCYGRALAPMGVLCGALDGPNGCFALEIAQN
ncbi:MAG: hypothetical protein ACI87O_001152 [Planctomycetota bacterium]|jgi:hypothetical protein